MDYAERLKMEAHGAHSRFHEYTLAVSKNEKLIFLFFEGEDDPCFYMTYLSPLLDGKEYIEYICNGRDGVIKTYDLISRDPRHTNSAMFFVDKDHTDFLNFKTPVANVIFQTDYYSFENYLVCDAVFRRFWCERLHLRIDDARYAIYLASLNNMVGNFYKKMKFFTSIILLGRGIEGRTPVKLNLNNVCFENLFTVDLENLELRWKRGALRNFLNASKNRDDKIDFTLDEVRLVSDKYLVKSSPKQYVRGKYELCFFVKFLQTLTIGLSNKKAAHASGLKRATPHASLYESNSVELLASLTPKPASLNMFFEDFFDRREKHVLAGHVLPSVF